MTGIKKLIRRITFFLFLFSSFESSAALLPDSIGVETRGGVRFIRHQVVSGEGWYSIARKYGISYSELRMANKEGGDQLAIGQVLLIPAKAKINDPRYQKNYVDEKANVTPEKKPATVSDNTKVSKSGKTHTVASSETLFSIAKKYSISVDQLKKLNGLNTNTISVGQILIVGTGDSGQEKNTAVSTSKAAKEEVKGNVPDAKKEVPKSTTKTVEDDSAVEKKETTVLVRTAAPDKVKTEEKKEEKKYAFANGRQEIKEQGVASWIEDEDINPNKYYALHRSAPMGTIIKITNRMNNNTVFVKVVGVLQDTGDNEGLIIKISKASAERLNVLDKKFQAELVYGLSEK